MLMKRLADPRLAMLAALLLTGAALLSFATVNAGTGQDDPAPNAPSMPTSAPSSGLSGPATIARPTESKPTPIAQTVEPPSANPTALPTPLP
jgi:hypothetical protein